MVWTGFKVLTNILVPERYNRSDKNLSTFVRKVETEGFLTVMSALGGARRTNVQSISDAQFLLEIWIFFIPFFSFLPIIKHYVLLLCFKFNVHWGLNFVPFIELCLGLNVVKSECFLSLPESYDKEAPSYPLMDGEPQQNSFTPDSWTCLRRWKRSNCKGPRLFGSMVGPSNETFVFPVTWSRLVVKTRI